MAASLQHALTSVPSTVVSSLSCSKSEVVGSAVQGLPVLRLSSSVSPRPLKIVASGGKKLNVKQPFGPSGGLKLKNGVDANGRKPTGKGVYQFSKKYGANVDGYSPIYEREEWSKSGDVYAGGQTGLLLWAVTLAAILLGGALLVYNTSALS
ncbi:hypothetical protein R1sor_019390 [Riccia sorocarpa]|uniref:Photosystem II 10 kDa polypeptide, chloroplastic n=1 Tax=Riccia sorocarpa TaxID=122646 RepID=A0ABD3ICE9_9MARC